ncbi:MCE family protein [Aeromicrobium fastidiosum]|uniref:MCE family protein n=1 Tax=Aeromicrobium fastidiosum TaxID=52699 RepID=A0A641AST5_9ACTN|nr:MCE family protein [Aeromicrobium fastidiosum]KAA1380131.1 MCE family protein [Aeromicrobium fastidiosum]MBP2389665.1 phospholipid/cholesterol/gamma-HCH transport system substrate-binding protein [Aeromicrobium fastidiosum]
MRGRLLDAGLGLGYLALAALLVGVAVLTYDRAFVSSVDVDLRTGPVGNALQKGSDVKLNGVPVGTVAKVRSDGEGAVIELALEPDTAKELPRDTTARLLPKTLFGERYVSLVTPATKAGEGLTAGDTIVQDSSDESVELEQVFDELLPVLKSIQPEKLSATLGELSTTLRGRGDQIGDTLTTFGSYLDKLNPLVPQMTDDLAALGRVADVYTAAAPDLLDALDTLTTTSRTLVDQQTTLKDVYATVIGSSNAAEGFVSDNRQTIEVLADESRAALDAARPYAKQFPCLFKSARDFIPTMDKTLGKGTDEPGLHLRLNIVPSRGKYLAGKDAVKFASGKSARCPYVTGQVGTTPAAAAASGDPETIAPPRTAIPERIGDNAGLGQANSPAENQLVAEIVAPTQGLAPDDYPSWSSLLLGPSLRGTQVVLK